MFYNVAFYICLSAANTYFRSSKTDTPYRSPAYPNHSVHPERPTHQQLAMPPKRPRPPPHKVIVTLDLDCFYASVAIRERPHLRHKPVAIVQKHLCVTSNYVARRPENGPIAKLTPVSKALEACPNLVLIDGSDLAPFREASRQVVLAIRAFLADACQQALPDSPLPAPSKVPLQRHGLDEVYLDLTNLVHARALATDPPSHFAGYVEGHSVDEIQNNFFVIGSQLVHELRRHLCKETQLTASAGLSSTKLLSKLSASRHKPDSQTTFLPANPSLFVAHLNPRSLTGIGTATEARIHAWAKTNNHNLCTAADLLRIFAGSSGRAQLDTLLAGNTAHAQKVLALCSGTYDDLVVDDGDIPKSLSVEDAFRNAPSMLHLTQRLNLLARRFVALLRDDLLRFSRRPTTLQIRFRFRKHGFAAVTRSIPVPAETTSVANSDLHVHISDVLVKRVLSILKDFGGLTPVNVSELTLIGLGATNFRNTTSSQSSIGPINNMLQKANNVTACDKSEVVPESDKTPSLNRSREQNTTSIAIAHASKPSCPVCGSQLSTNNALLNSHIDRCVRSRSAPVPIAVPASKRPRTTSSTRPVDSYFSRRLKDGDA